MGGHASGTRTSWGNVGQKGTTAATAASVMRSKERERARMALKKQQGSKLRRLTKGCVILAQPGHVVPSPVCRPPMPQAPAHACGSQSTCRLHSSCGFEQRLKRHGAGQVSALLPSDRRQDTGKHVRHGAGRGPAGPHGLSRGGLAMNSAAVEDAGSGGTSASSSWRKSSITTAPGAVGAVARACTWAGWSLARGTNGTAAAPPLRRTVDDGGPAAGAALVLPPPPSAACAVAPVAASTVLPTPSSWGLEHGWASPDL